MAAMRRFRGLASISRTIDGGASATTATNHRFIQSDLFSTKVSPEKSHWFFGRRLVEHGALQFSGSFLNGNSRSAFFSVSAFSHAEEVHKQSPPIDKFLPKEVVLYQYEACPFCNKVKAFLDYYDITYKIVEVNPINKKEIKWSDYKKVPVLMVDGEQMNDSSAIIDNLFKKIHPEESTLENEEERKWRGWVDNHLVHVLSPNIYRNVSEALESFDYITTHGNFSFSERIIAKYGGAAAMYFVSKKLKKRHNITDERKALYEAAETWVEALNDRHFLGGEKPNLADLAVYGVLRPIRYLTSGKDMVENTRIGEWYASMERLVKKPTHSL